MKTRAQMMAVLLLSGLFAASCAAMNSPFLEQEEELTVNNAFVDRAGPGTSTMDILDREYGEALSLAQEALAEQEEELIVSDAFRDRAGPGTSAIDIIDQEYGEALRKPIPFE